MEWATVVEVVMVVRSFGILGRNTKRLADKDARTRRLGARKRAGIGKLCTGVRCTGHLQRLEAGHARPKRSRWRLSTGADKWQWEWERLVPAQEAAEG